MSTTKCDRCNRRMRNADGWNTNLVAGVRIGYLCPDCQTPAENLDAELNLITGATTSLVKVDPAASDDTFNGLVQAMVSAYPTPEVLRSKAGELDSARVNRTQAKGMAKLLRGLADLMESGDLWKVSA